MNRVFSLISSLVLFIFAICYSVMFIDGLSEDRRILNLESHGVHTQGVLIKEKETGTRSYAYFIASYDVGNKIYEFDWIDRNNEYKLNDTITVIYNRHDPSDYIVEGFYKDELLGTILFGLIFVLGFTVLAIILLHNFFKIGYLEKHGRRILCEVVVYYRSAKSIPYITVICKIPTDDKKKYKRYKGECGWTFEGFMRKNNLRYIPLYIHQDRKNYYYVHCDELRKIVKYRSYNGHTLEELQGL